MGEKIITRMPPSPTGHLHIGTARTALFNYLFAKSQDGEMILRSEDTDAERSTRAFETEIIEGLHWLGITWSNETLYRQSERSGIYRSYLEKAIEAGTAYISPEESKREPGTTVEVVRLKNPNTTISFTDLIRGEISFDTTELGDIVIARSLDDALYHFTVVVDDHEMGVTHVLRGEDHISNTPRQILIQEAIGASRPEYAHMPLILAPDRSKMSKRHGAVALQSYIDMGFVRDALVNYLALLGWNPGTEQEIFTMDELIAQFSLEKMQKGGAVFDLEKFKWINKEHLDRMDSAAFTTEALRWMPERLTKTKQFDERFPKLLPTIRERVHTLGEITEAAEAGEYDFAFTDIEYETELLKWKKDDSVSDVLPRLETLISLLEGADFTSIDTITAAIWNYAEETGKGEVLWPLRVALTGRERSPDPFTCAYILGQETTLLRLKTACDKIES